MKRLLFIAALLIGTANVFAQGNVGGLDFKTSKVSFGKIKKGKPATTEFAFTNTGGKTVVIETATADCGCTTPVFPTAPILPGKTGTIKVTYNAAEAGMFSKKVYVKVAKVQEPFVLTIEGEVKK